MMIIMIMMMMMMVNNMYGACVLQVIGWSMWFSDYVFLERSWDKDKEILNVYISNIYTYSPTVLYDNQIIIYRSNIHFGPQIME